MRTRTVFLVLGAAVGVRSIVRHPHVRRWGRSLTRDVQVRLSGQAHPRLPAELLEPLRETVEPADQLSMRLDDAAATPGGLVDAERDLLTVAGDGHRRRNQRSGVASQQIAAAQVRLRRHSHDEPDY